VQRRFSGRAEPRLQPRLAGRDAVLTMFRQDGLDSVGGAGGSWRSRPPRHSTST